MKRHVLAPLWRRGVAWWLDMLVISIPLLLWFIGIWSQIGAMPHAARHGVGGFSDEALLCGWLLLTLGYYTMMEALWGATLGKRLLKIRVVATDGAACGWRASLLRNFLRFADAMALWPIGAIVICCSKKRQRIGDILADTLVIKNES